MFRKIVTESTYSPAIAVSLNDYIRLLKSQTSRRQIGLIFVVLAIFVQLFAITFPSESANAENPGTFIDGGIQSIDEYLGYYDQNAEGVRDLLASLGITRLNIETSIPTSLQSTGNLSVWSMENTRSEGDHVYSFPVGRELRTAHHRPFSTEDTPAAYVGSSPTLGWFALLKKNGNLVTKNPILTGCTPWSPALSADEPECLTNLELSLSSQNISATTTGTPETAKASERISYTLSVKNGGDSVVSTPLAINLEDILEYAQLLNRGGGEFDATSQTLRWPEVTLAAGETIQRTFIVQVLSTIPSTAQGQHITSSYDCVMGVSFGNTIDTPVACPLIKQVEQVTNSLPHTDMKINIAIAVFLLAVTLYLYFRSNQLLHELHVIRHNHLGGL